MTDRPARCPTIRAGRASPPGPLAVECGPVTALAVWRTAETRGRDLSVEDPAPEHSPTRTASRGAEA
ncbi:hypothetical protein ACFCWY_28080 [Streptomyces sp. NPDC056362]|uniref:hypothetical protein n=1 Tax=unclassified Streptomyces TaxID=2593676 RepID=UPI0035D5732D